jgi:hypothetical protein
MGSAIYYLKARYETDLAARQAADEFLPYVEDLEKMELHWQKIRNDYEQPCFYRLKILLEKHPKAVEFLPSYLRCPSEKDRNMNFLAHIIPDVEPNRVDFDLVVKKNILYMKSWAWHLSDWDPITRWLVKHGALRATWSSSERVGMMPGPKDWKPGGPITPFDQFQV